MSFVLGLLFRCMITNCIVSGLSGLDFLNSHFIFSPKNIEFDGYRCVVLEYIILRLGAGLTSPIAYIPIRDLSIVLHMSITNIHMKTI